MGYQRASTSVRLLLRLFPRPFRRWYARDLLELYRDIDRRDGASGGRRHRRIWWDVVANGLAVRLDDLRDRLVGAIGRGVANPPRSPEHPTIPERRRTRMQSILPDLRFAARTLHKNPAFTAVVVLSLGLGIGVNTAIFSVIDAALLRELPVVRPGDLVVLHWIAGPEGSPDLRISGWMRHNDAGRSESSSFSNPFVERLREENDMFSEVFTFDDLGRVNVGVDGRAELASGHIVSGNYYVALGIGAHIGRLLGPADDAPDAVPAAVLSHGYWQRRFGADGDVLGKLVYLNGVPFTIVGVEPRGFAGTLQLGDRPDVAVALAMQPRVRPTGPRLDDGGYWWLHVMGRVRSEVEWVEAEAYSNLLFQRSVMAEMPDLPEGELPSIALTSGAQGMTELRDTISGALFTGMSVVGLVLLIACVNVANLLLARSGTRQREIAVRLSLGASRWRLVRQLLTESFLLSVVAGFAGVLAATWGRDILIGLVTRGDELLTLDACTDARALVFTLLISVLTGLLFGLAPAMRATRFDLTPALKDDSRSIGGSRAKLGLHKTLMGLQVALSLVLLIVAGLFVRTLQNLELEATGFDPDGVLQFRIDPRLNNYDGSSMARLYGELRESLRLIPGVGAATLANNSPVSGRISYHGLHIAGYTPAEGERMGTVVNLVAPDFFETFGIPLLIGRGIEASDDAGSRKVAVVNEALASRFFPDESPIGKRVGFESKEAEAADIEIVGVATNVKYQSPHDDMHPVVHLSYLQHEDDLGAMTFAARATGDTATLIGSFREAVASVDPNLPLFEVRSLSQQRDATLVQERQFASLSSGLGALAIALMCIGLYGILSYSVVRRTPEIGVRIALGAQQRDVMRLVMRELMPVFVGIAAGLGAAFATTRFLESLLYGLTPTDPLSIAAAVAGLAVIAVVAAYLPARRASRVDPIVALRYE